MEQFQKAIYIYLAGAIVLLFFTSTFTNILAAVLLLGSAYEVSRMNAAKSAKPKAKRKATKKKK